MKIHHICQENKSSGCGPACIAMIVGRDYDEVREIMFPSQTRGLWTGYADLRKALVKFGAKPIGKAVRAARFEAADEICIFAVKKSSDKERWHWVVYDPTARLVYDPLLSAPLHFEEKLNKRYRPFSRQAVKLPARQPHTLLKAR